MTNEDVAAGTGSAAARNSRYPTFVFVAQAGSLERMALLLAASIRRLCGAGPELIAATPVPQEVWGGALDQRTLAAFERMGVQIAPITNPFGPRFPIGNKLACLAVESVGSEIVFLDTDILMMSDFPQRVLFAGPIEAVPETSVHLPVSVWEQAYREFGLAPPDRRMTTLGTGEVMLPLFNSGFVATTVGDELARAWAEVSLTLDRSDTFPQRHKEWGLDEFALPIAAKLIGVEIASVSMAFNFPSWEFPLGGRDPVFWHYQRGRRILKQRRTFDAAVAAVEAYPEIKDLLAEDPELSLVRTAHSFTFKRARVVARKLLRREERRHNRHVKPA